MNKYITKLRYKVVDSKEPYFVTFPSLGVVANELDVSLDITFLVLYLTRKLIRRKFRKKVEYTPEILLETSLITDDLFKLPLNFNVIADDLSLPAASTLEIRKTELKLYFSLLRSLKVELSALSLLPDGLFRYFNCTNVTQLLNKLTSPLVTVLFALEMKNSQ